MKMMLDTRICHTGYALILLNGKNDISERKCATFKSVSMSYFLVSIGLPVRETIWGKYLEYVGRPMYMSVCRSPNILRNGKRSCCFFNY